MKNARDLNVNPNNPYASKKSEQHQDILNTYGKLIEALEKSKIEGDAALAARVKAFQEQMPANQTATAPDKKPAPKKDLSQIKTPPQPSKTRDPRDVER